MKSFFIQVVAFVASAAAEKHAYGLRGDKDAIVHDIREIGVKRSIDVKDRIEDIKRSKTSGEILFEMKNQMDEEEEGGN